MKFLSILFAAGALATSVSHTALSSELTSPGEYAIDQGHSSVTFEVDHLGFAKVVGRFNDLSGNFTVAPNKPSSLNVTIQSASIDTNHDKRDDHLRSPDFFNAKQFPTITFSSPLDIKTVSGQAVVKGNLTLLGVSKPIVLNIKKGNEGKDPWGLYRAGYTATTTIKRSDYGMNFMQGGLGDDIQVTINIEAVKQ
jgi:polyisoprenoid-binding protein YceI